MKRCNWDCSRFHVHATRMVIGQEAIDVCVWSYCTDDEVADTDAPKCSEPYRFAQHPDAAKFLPPATGRIAFVTFGDECRKGAWRLF